jgi:hypothetical protein
VRLICASVRPGLCQCRETIAMRPGVRNSPLGSPTLEWDPCRGKALGRCYDGDDSDTDVWRSLSDRDDANTAVSCCTIQQSLLAGVDGYASAMIIVAAERNDNSAEKVRDACRWSEASRWRCEVAIEWIQERPHWLRAARVSTKTPPTARERMATSPTVCPRPRDRTGATSRLEPLGDDTALDDAARASAIATM